MRKAKIKKPPVSFLPAPAIEEVAVGLIRQYHPHLLKHSVRIEYIFRSDTPKKNGRTVPGSIRIVGSLNAFFGRPDRSDAEAPIKRFFAMVVSEPTWKYMKPEQRAAMVDHLLCHAGAEFDDEGGTKLSMVPHDLEEFRGIVERHGYWDRDLQRFAKSVLDSCPQERLTFEE